MELYLRPLPTLGRTGRQGRPPSFKRTGGDASGYQAVEGLMALRIIIPCMLMADKGYDGDAVRETLLFHGILPVILPRANRS